MTSELPQRADIGPRLIQVAESAGYSMSALSRELGAALTTINRWKKGAEPRVAYVDRVADLSGESLMFLIRGIRGAEHDAPPPEYDVWRQTMAPMDATRAELDTLASVRFKVAHPGPQWYALALAGIRSSPVAQTSEIRRGAR